MLQAVTRTEGQGCLNTRSAGVHCGPELFLDLPAVDAFGSLRELGTRLVGLNKH